MISLRDSKKRLVRKTLVSCNSFETALGQTLKELSVNDMLNIKRVTLMPYGQTILSCHIQYLDDEKIVNDLYQNLMFAAQAEEDEYKKDLFRESAEKLLLLEDKINKLKSPIMCACDSV